MKRIAYSIFALLLFVIGIAAVTANSVITAQTPNRGVLQIIATASCTGSITPAGCCTGSGTGCTAGTYYTIYTAGANGSRCNALWMDNDDASAAHLITVVINNGTTNVGGVALTSVVSAGFVSGTPTQNMLLPSVWTGLPLDSDSNPYFELNSGDTLKATYATAITATDFIDIHVNCSDF